MMLMNSVLNTSGDRLRGATALLPDLPEIHAEAGLRRGHELAKALARSEDWILALDRYRAVVVALVASRRRLDLVKSELDRGVST